ncbi:hypothetical protein MKX01_026567 [Papaver californicum]|nr:hypothetical protein MKX01_026567 [Papaver californicum]
MHRTCYQISHTTKGKQALPQHRDKFEFGTFQKKNDDLCSSEKELNFCIKELIIQQICNLYYRTRCGKNTCVEEKKLCTTIKLLEETREKFIYNDNIKEECFNFQEEFIWRKFQCHMDLNKLRREKQVYSARLKYLQEKVKSLNNEIRTLEVTLITTKKSKAAQKRLHELQKEQNVERTGRTL